MSGKTRPPALRCAAVDPAAGPTQTPLELFLIHLRRADIVFPDANYLPLLRRLPTGDVETDRSALLYPDPVK